MELGVELISLEEQPVLLTVEASLPGQCALIAAPAAVVLGR